MHLHTQAKIYVILAIIAIIMNFMFTSWHQLLFNILFILGWTLLIEYVGKKGHKSVSWVLAILPFAVLFYVKSARMNQMLANIGSTMSKGMPSGSANGQKK